jgi:sulfatase maturation enzyme AslB (radical SAM superfamily)
MPLQSRSSSLPVLGQGKSVHDVHHLHPGPGQAPPASDWGGYRYLPVELFRTDLSFYVFDARNVCFLKVDAVAYELLAILRERKAGLEELIGLLPQHPEEEVRAAWRDLEEVQAEGFLLPYRFQRVARHENSEYEEVLSRRMGGFTLFVTTQCNLGCSYCIYGGQYEQHEELSQTRMPWETLRDAMEFLARRSGESKQVRLDFFGGEPLLAFDLIERGVRHLKSILPPDGPVVVVTITSNGTVLTDRLLDFLLENHVYLQFSIDGGRESHDRFRPFKSNGRGSFDVILGNLQRIHDRDPEYFRTHMRIKGVLTTELVDRDDPEFFGHPLVRSIIDNNAFIFINEEPHFDLSKDADYFERIDRLGRQLLEREGVQGETGLLDGLNPKQKALYHHTLGRFFELQAVNRFYFDGRDAAPFIKGCLTGYQEGAVSANGDISICLKSAKGNNFVIGNVVEDEWYFDKIRGLNTLFHQDWSGCSSCFLQKSCDLCYEKLNGDEGLWVSGRSRFCEFNRARHRVLFETMLRITERNPALWEEFESSLRERLSGEEPAEDDAARYASRNLLSGSSESD